MFRIICKEVIIPNSVTMNCTNKSCSNMRHISQFQPFIILDAEQQGTNRLFQEQYYFLGLNAL
jgi:hypothetical protein